jgi:hypothetical protein
MSDILVDGGVVAGVSADVTINGTVYAMNSFNQTTGTTKVLRTDRNNKPSGRKIIRGETTATAELQLATSATPEPDVCDTFTYAAATWEIESKGKTETKAGETVLPITICKAITGSIVKT